MTESEERARLEAELAATKQKINNLELAKVALGVLTPLLVTGIGAFLALGNAKTLEAAKTTKEEQDQAVQRNEALFERLERGRASARSDAELIASLKEDLLAEAPDGPAGDDERARQAMAVQLLKFGLGKERFEAFAGSVKDASPNSHIARVLTEEVQAGREPAVAGLFDARKEVRERSMAQLLEDKTLSDEAADRILVTMLPVEQKSADGTVNAIHTLQRASRGWLDENCVDLRRVLRAAEVKGPVTTKAAQALAADLSCKDQAEPTAAPTTGPTPVVATTLAAPILGAVVTVTRLVVDAIPKSDGKLLEVMLSADRLAPGATRASKTWADYSQARWGGHAWIALGKASVWEPKEIWRDRFDDAVDLRVDVDEHFLRSDDGKEIGEVWVRIERDPWRVTCEKEEGVTSLTLRDGVCSVAMLTDGRGVSLDLTVAPLSASEAP